MPVPQSQRIVTIAPILFAKKASVVGATTRPLDDGGLIIGFIWFGLNSNFISELCVIDCSVSFLLDSCFGGPTSKGSKKKGKSFWHGEFYNR